MFVLDDTVFASSLHTVFENEDEFNTWTVEDVNDDGATWTFDSAASPSFVFYSYSVNAADDWMISPEIVSEKSGTLAVSLTVQGSSYGEKLQVFCGKEGKSEAMTTALSEVINLSADITSYLFMTEVTAGEPIYLGLHACSDADKWRIYLIDVKATYTDNPVDIQASEIISPVSAFNLGEESVTVKVKNSGNADIESFDISLAVDDETIATETVNTPLAAGAETEYTFTAKADLSEPRKSFNLKAWTSHPDDLNPGNDACTAEVLHKAPAKTPYSMGFEPDEYTAGITFFNLNEDDGDWDVYTDFWYSLARTGDYCLAYNYNKENNADDWAILEPITIEEAGYYVLKFWYSGDDTHPEKLGVYYGNEASPEAMTNTIVEYAPFARSAYEESINIIYIENPQDIYIGFHAFSDKDENWICVDDVTFERITDETTDLGIYDLTNPMEYVHKGSKKSIDFAVRNLGIADVKATVTVKIDDNVILEKEEDVKAQATIQYNLADALSELGAGVHTLQIEVANSDDTSVDNNSKTLQFRVMGTPTKMWDFEDGKLPAEFVFRSEDGGTVNPGAGEEFNEEGFAIFNIYEHELYGEYMMAMTSWIDGVEKADRWCVLPAYRPAEESFLVWDASSLSEKYLENYSIMVSSNGDNSFYYFKEEEITAESTVTKTRGVDLSSYAGQEIYVALRLHSKICEHLIVDNIGFYGGEVASVENISVQTPTMRLENGTLTVSAEGVATIELFDMSGRIVARTDAGQLSTENIPAGIYIVKAVTATGTLSEKVVIK